MFRKSVVACALSSAIIGTTLPDRPLLADTRAGNIAAKKQASGAIQKKPIAKAAPLHKHRRDIRARHSHRRQNVVAQATAHRAVVVLGGSDKFRAARLGTFAITAYTHYRNRRGGVNKTATGVFPQVGRTVAVDPRVIPLGSRIHIAGVGERIAEDTGRKIKGRKLDLFLPSVRECRQFGVRRHEVHLLAKETRGFQRP